jgi:anthranilate/para-aminobenzoate synthase component II
MPIINNDNIPKVVITETINDVVVASPGPQGPRGKTILNGNGVPAENLINKFGLKFKCLKIRAVVTGNNRNGPFSDI